MAKKVAPTSQKKAPAVAVKEITKPGNIPGWLVPVLLAITFLIFSPSLRNEFVNWDDHAYLTENPVIKSMSGENLKHIFTPSTYVVGNYHPLTVLTYCIEYSLVELKPFLYHFDNIILHCLNVLLVFLFIRALFGQPLTALITAILFAIHPLRVESVTWAAERKDVLYTLFFIASLYCYTLFAKENYKKWGPFIVSLLMFAASCLAKGQAVVLFGVVVIIDIYLKRPLNARFIVEKIPFLAIALLFGYFAIKAQHTSLTDARFGSYTGFQRFLFVCYGLIHYLKDLVFPFKLTCFYDYPMRPGKAAPWWLFVCPLLVLTLAIFAFRQARKNAQFMWGILFFIGTIIIVLQILPVGDAVAADRYTYIPFLGLFFIIGYSVNTLWEKHPAKRMLIKASSAGVFILFSVLSFVQCMAWKNSESLWTDLISKYPDVPIAYNNRGVVYLNDKQLDKAYADFTKAIELDPTFYMSFNNLGTYYNKKGQHELEIKQYDRAIELTPGYTLTYFNRGLAYASVGQHEKAIADYNFLIQVEPENAQVYYSKGMAEKALGRYPEAIENYNTALKLNPNYSEALTNRGNVYFNLKQYPQALEDYNRSITLDPKASNAYFNRSAVYYYTGQPKKALEDALKAKELGHVVDPGYIQAINAVIH